MIPRTLHFLPPFLENPAFMHNYRACDYRGSVDDVVCVRHAWRDARCGVGRRARGSGNGRPAISMAARLDVLRGMKRAAQVY